MNIPEPRNSGTFRTMTEKATDATWKKWALVAGAVVSFGGATKVLIPAVAPLLGIAQMSDLKWRTDKILYMEQVAANKEIRISVLETELVTAKRQIEEMKIDIRELRAR